MTTYLSTNEAWQSTIDFDTPNHDAQYRGDANATDRRWYRCQTITVFAEKFCVFWRNDQENRRHSTLRLVWAVYYGVEWIEKTITVIMIWIKLKKFKNLMIFRNNSYIAMPNTRKTCRWGGNCLINSHSRSNSFCCCSIFEGSVLSFFFFES